VAAVPVNVIEEVAPFEPPTPCQVPPPELLVLLQLVLLLREQELPQP
jgi:hypothetical protein